MQFKKDLTNKQFGRLTVIEYAGKNNRGQSLWKCRCECGKEKDIIGASLSYGATQSCGCLGNEKRMEKVIKHGKSYSRAYRIWTGMKQRTQNSASLSYSNYGGRGICMAPEWESFERFLADMGEPPPRSTLERVDNSLGYRKENCKWASYQEQSRNKRNNQLLALFGVTLCLRDWSKVLEVPYGTLQSRYVRLRWSVEDTLLTPVQERAQ